MTAMTAMTRLSWSHGKWVITALVALLWLTSDLLSLRQLHATLRPLMIDTTQTEWPMNSGLGERLPQIAKLITANTPGELAVATVSLDQSGDFYAQKLPLILAPQPAVSVSLTQTANLAKTWQGHFVLFSSNKALLLKEANSLVAQTRLQIMEQGDDYVFLTMGNR
jgi:hypothetical protein